MLIALIVVVMLWYSFRTRDKSRQWLKELSDRDKIEIHTVNDPQNPANFVCYTDLIDEVNMVQSYQRLVKDYEVGLISPTEFHELLTELTDKISIRDILEV